MKKLFFLLLPLAALADTSYELYPSKECEALKSDYMAQINEIQNLNGSQRVNLLGLNQQLIGIRSFGEAVTNIQDEAKATDFDTQSIASAYATVAWANGSLETVSTMLDNNSTNNYRLGLLLTSVQNIDCGKCGSDSTNCCDFTQIEQTLHDIYLDVNAISADTNMMLEWFDYFDTIIEPYFDNVTGLLGASTNLFSQLIHDLYKSVPSTQHNLQWYGYNSPSGSSGNASLQNSPNYSVITAPSSSGWLNTFWSAIKIFNYKLGSLNDYQYYFQSRHFPILTNIVGSISKGVSFITNDLPIFAHDTTNLLTSLRADINPQHSLADWGGGSIYEYLTNQYLTAIDASPSNWHSRIETLLAALVFRDSAAREKEIEDEISDGLSDVEGRQSELEGAFDSEETITFLDTENLEKFEMPDIEVGDDQLPDSLVITFGGFSWFEDSYNDQDMTIDLTDNDLRDFLTLVRSFFRILWWGSVLLIVWWLFKWFLRFLVWVWSAIKGIDFGS